MKVKKRNLDSLNRLSLSRAKGRAKQIDKRKSEISSTLRVLDNMGLLTFELLEKLSLVYCELSNERMKLYFRIRFLEKVIPKVNYESGVKDRIDCPITGIRWFGKGFNFGSFNYKRYIKYEK